jgi:hypothetical protein
MKCIKNKKTGNILRVNDLQATQMVGSSWDYASKSEWKSILRPKVVVEQTPEPTTDNTVKKHKK